MGDCLADWGCGGGGGGGGSISVMCSGEIELFSEVSVLTAV